MLIWIQLIQRWIFLLTSALVLGIANRKYLTVFRKMKWNEKDCYTKQYLDTKFFLMLKNSHENVEELTCKPKRFYYYAKIHRSLQPQLSIPTVTFLIFVIFSLLVFFSILSKHNLHGKYSVIVALYKITSFITFVLWNASF